MPEKDAIKAVEDAAAKVKALEGAHDELIRAVRVADALGYPRARLAERAGVHRNTIARWCDGSE